jgi:hypothetical protein
LRAAEKAREKQSVVASGIEARFQVKARFSSPDFIFRAE